MKRTVVFGWMALAGIAVAAPSFAGDPAMPGVERRQQVQQRRIGQGIESGQLTPREAARLEREQAGIERAQRRAESDGRITPRERARLHRKQDRASRHIYREKHDAQTGK
ncbi:MAG: hypothetical protein OHK0028_20960 [Deltaproteobacteria bacterium]